MCIIAIKPSGVEMPDTKTISNMWGNNPDGAGYMIATGKSVLIRKGFMRQSDFEDAISAEGDLKKKAVVMHFRITTHGGTCKENCHPFPITSSVTEIKKTTVNTDIGVAHNGIISNVTPRKGISDTMEYIISQLSYAKKIDKLFYRKQDWLDMIENAIESKMVFLDRHGKFNTIGKFTEDKGMLYSNDSYSREPWSKLDKWSWKDCGNDIYDKYDKCDWLKLMKIDDYMKYKQDTGFNLDLGIQDSVYYDASEDEFAIDGKGMVYCYEPYMDCWEPISYSTVTRENGEPIEYIDKIAEYCPVESW